MTATPPDSGGGTAVVAPFCPYPTVAVSGLTLTIGPSWSADTPCWITESSGLNGPVTITIRADVPQPPLSPVMRADDPMGWVYVYWMESEGRVNVSSDLTPYLTCAGQGCAFDTTIAPVFPPKSTPLVAIPFLQRKEWDLTRALPVLRSGNIRVGDGIALVVQGYDDRSFAFKLIPAPDQFKVVAPPPSPGRCEPGSIAFSAAHTFRCAYIVGAPTLYQWTRVAHETRW